MMGGREQRMQPAATHPAHGAHNSLQNKHMLLFSLQFLLHGDIWKFPESESSEQPGASSSGPLIPI